MNGAMLALRLDGEAWDGRDLAAMSALELDAVHRQVVARLRELARELDAAGATMATPLVMPDGFPRSDLDVVQVRLVRRAIVRVRNDLARVEGLLADQVLLGAAAGAAAPAAPAALPFARVGEVVAGSPAETGGLAVGDMVVRVGGQRGLEAMAAAVRSAAAARGLLEWEVVRAGAPVLVTVHPQTWAGSGVLGARVDRA